MPKIELSDAGLRSLRPPQRGTIDYWDTKLPSFGCRVSQGGAKTFVLKLRNSRRAVGRYPLISLSEARAEARKLLAEKTLGRVRPQALTFQAAADAFLKEKERSRRPRTVANLRARLAQHFPFRGQLADFTHQELVRYLKKIKTNSEHDHALSVAKTFFTWAFNHRYITENPATGLSPHGAQSRSRVLSDTELAAIWRSSDGMFGLLVKLLISTGQRRGEIAALHWEWVDEDARTISFPATLTKNGRPHTIPFGPISYEILGALGSKELLFAARGKSTPFNGWSKCKAHLDSVSGVRAWTLHDLRRTFATNLAALGAAPHVVEKLLNHVSGTISGVAAIYNRYAFEKECRAAVEAWEARLQTILEQP